MLAIMVAACEQRTVVEPGATTHAAELGLEPRPARARGDDYATKALAPGRGIGDVRLGTSTLADVERILGTDYRISSLTTTQECGPDGCRESPPRFAFEYRRLAITVGFERAAAGSSVEQSRVRVVSVHCAAPERCAWRGTSDKGLRIGDSEDRVAELHPGGRKRRGSGNWVHPDGLAVAFARGTGTVETITVFRPEDLREVQ